VAAGADIKITRSELEKRAAARLLPLQQEQYDVLRESLDQLLGEHLLKREAEARRVGVDALLKSEVDAKVPEADPAEVARLYEENKAQLAGRPREEALAQIRSFVRGQTLEGRRAAFLKDLIKRAGVKITFEPPRTKLSIPGSAPSLGPEDAPVTLVEFADYQCAYCQRAEHTIEELLKRYPGKMRLVQRDFPLDSVHSRAFAAAKAVHCAGDQGQFWEYHRSLLEAPGDLSDSDLGRRAGSLHLDLGAFSSCVSSMRHESEIREGLEQGSNAGVSATPTFFLNGRMVVGSRTVEQFEALIDSELEAPAQLGG
jgi:protein-disulfide isomerase